MSGIEKRIDSLGRVVIPIEFRRLIGADRNPRVRISYENNTIIISAASNICALCGEKIEECQELRLCDACIFKIKTDI